MLLSLQKGCKQEKNMHLKNSKENKVLFKVEQRELEEDTSEFSMVRKRSMDEVCKLVFGCVCGFGVEILG